jgi:hypothetical protein
LSVFGIIKEGGGGRMARMEHAPEDDCGSKRKARDGGGDRHPVGHPAAAFTDCLEMVFMPP